MSQKFRKGDVVNYRFTGFAGTGILMRKIAYKWWDILVEGEHQDVRCHENDGMSLLDKPLNVFDLIRE